MLDFFVMLLAIRLGITTVETPVSPSSISGADGGQALGGRREALGVRGTAEEPGAMEMN
jgi:hypothetical protein